MPRMFPRQVSVLVLALAAMAGPTPAADPGSLAPFQLAALKAQQASRAVLAHAQLLQTRSQLGLGDRSEFRINHAFTNAQGRAVVRFDQTLDGRRVWGGGAIAHVEPDGEFHALTQGVQPVAALAPAAPALTEAQALQIALQNLAPKGSLKQSAKVELVAFPTRFASGLAVRFDAAKGRMVFDPAMSTWARPPAADQVWAYEVRTFLLNPADGHQETSYIIDADSGAILRKWSELQPDSPAQGTGRSYYRGTVPLSTTRASDGTYQLRSQERGTLPQPFLADQGLIMTGMTTWYGVIYLTQSQVGYEMYEGHQGNAWGDGTVMPFPYDPGVGAMLLDFNADHSVAWERGALTPAGETTAVDAHYGLSTTWDFYKAVFHRNGIDDLGTSTFAVVHSIQVSGGGAYPFYDNAHWAPWLYGMEFGDGSGTVLGPNGFKALTEIDITGHELTHGVCQTSANLIYSGYSGGLNEADSDMLGKMVQAWADGGASGGSIPDFPAGDLTKWCIGLNSATTPLRYMYHPSLDGASVDAWYDGAEQLDVHYNSGPPNRFFYFLCCGASGDSTKTTYSPYLPGGMTGVGNDKAARIWYKTLTEHLPQDADYDVARAGCISSAQELYGTGSAEETAVRKAWAAVNVGEAPGQAPRPRVTFPVIHGAGSFLDNNAAPKGILKKVQIFPTSATVQIHVDVQNTTNKAVDFTAPDWTGGDGTAGTINPDGTWTTPNWQYYLDLLSVTATSKADPTQFAKGYVLLCDLDSDQDTELDAIDLGATAMAWYKSGQYFAPPQPKARTAGGGDWDLVFFTEAFTNAWPVK